MNIPQALHDSAKTFFKEHFGKGEHVFSHVASDKHPETETDIYLFHARAVKKPNQPAVELVLDDTGKSVELGHARNFVFLPKIPKVASDMVDAVKATIDPPFNRLTLTECDEFSETITVTIPKSAAVAPADIYFLADNTGSMGPSINSVRTNANAIFAALNLPGLQFGVGEYQDFENPGDPPSAAFKNLQSITANTAAVTAAFGAWVAVGGGDGPEAAFYALDQIAPQPGGVVGWRPGVQHIVVWFGDAPSHDAICKAVTGLGYDITEGTVTAKLAANNITILALSLTTGDYPAAGLDDDPKNLVGPLNTAYGSCGAPGGASGQVTRITSATHGVLVNGLDANTIVQTIIDELKALLMINDVHLQPVGAIAPFVTSITPSHYGPLHADQENVLSFHVTFSGDVVDCATRDRVFTGEIDAIADGNIIAVKPTEITVPACKFSYAVKFVCGTQGDCDCNCGPVRPGRYATEINILNLQCKKATIEKRLIPLVFAGAPSGREPGISHVRAVDHIALPAGTATMDDCCRIAQLLYGGVPAPMPLTIGFMEIVSDRELQVTAVYTATDLQGNGLNVDVANIEYKLTPAKS